MTTDEWGDDTAEFWKHLYESCDPKFCVWCDVSKEFKKWREENPDASDWGWNS